MNELRSRQVIKLIVFLFIALPGCGLFKPNLDPPVIPAEIPAVVTTARINLLSGRFRPGVFYAFSDSAGSELLDLPSYANSGSGPLFKFSNSLPGDDQVHEIEKKTIVVGYEVCGEKVCEVTEEVEIALHMKNIAHVKLTDPQFILEMINRPVTARESNFSAEQKIMQWRALLADASASANIMLCTAVDSSGDATLVISGNISDEIARLLASRFFANSKLSDPMQFSAAEYSGNEKHHSFKLPGPVIYRVEFMQARRVIETTFPRIDFALGEMSVRSAFD